MSTEPSHDANDGSPSKQRLPFEPRQKRPKNRPTKPEPSATKNTQKQDKQAPTSQESSKTQLEASLSKTATKKNKPAAVTRNSMVIPDVVSKRMARRMAVLCGIPSVLGISTFFVSYFLVTKLALKLPNVAVVLVSMGFFGLGVLGLSYGVLSASWDEEIPGTTLGWQEFTTNLGRMTSAWGSARQKD
jgi:hypothetical protein